MSIAAELVELLDRNEYRVVMSQTDRGCLAEFPTRKEIPLLSFTRLYQEFTEKGVDCTTYDADGQELFTHKVSVPSYAQKIWTIYHVISQCMTIGYGSQAIKFKVGGNEAEEQLFLQKHVSPFATKGDAEKEEALQQLIALCFQQGFSDRTKAFAQQQGILDGYLAVKNLFAVPGPPGANS